MCGVLTMMMMAIWFREAVPTTVGSRSAQADVSPTVHMLTLRQPQVVRLGLVGVEQRERGVRSPITRPTWSNPGGILALGGYYMRCNAPGPQGLGCMRHTQKIQPSRHQVHPRAATGSLVLVSVLGLKCGQPVSCGLQWSTVCNSRINIAWKALLLRAAARC